MLVPRFAEARPATLAQYFRVVVVSGPRQAGKTTLLELHRAASDGTLRSLDDPTG